MALILITHDLGVVAGMCDRVAVMYAGQIVEEAPTDDIFATPSHPYTLGLLRSVPRIDRDPSLDPTAELPTIEGTPPDLAALPPGCPFVPRCSFAFDRCGAVPPPLAEISPGHAARCWVDVQTGRPK